jgi:cytochrome c5
MKKRLVFTIVAVAMVFTGIGVVTAADDPAAKALFEDSCSICHTTEYATDLADTEAGWRDTVTRMIEENGVDLSKEDAETIIKYLATNYGE